MSPYRFKANRKAWGAPFCLATKTRPHFSLFSRSTVKGGMSGLVPDHVEGDENFMNLQCFPLYSLMLAVGNPTINFLSLDIEGAEYLVSNANFIPQIKRYILASRFFNPYPGTRWIYKFLE